MDISSEEAPLPEVLDNKALLQEFLDLDKWRKEQRQMFQNRQLVENRRLLENSQEKQRHWEQVIVPNVSKASQENDSNERISCENSFVLNSTANSTPTGHILRCFSDTSGDSSAFSKNEEHDATSVCAVRSKRPFLRKRSGLARFMPKSSQQSKVSKSVPASKTQETISYAQAILKSEQNHCNTTSITSTVNHVHFDVPNSNASNQGKRVEMEEFPRFQVEPDSKLSQVYCKEPDSIVSKKETGFETQVYPISDGINNECYSEIVDEATKNLNQEHEKEELRVFELLENCAQNCSFNSDSSVVQRVLRGESVLPPQNTKEKPHVNSSYVERLKPQLCTNSSNVDSSSSKVGLLKLKQDILKKKQPIEDIIFDNEHRINHLRREAAISPQEILLETEIDTNGRCSTPVGQIIQQEHLSSPITSDANSSFNRVNSPDQCILATNNDDSDTVNENAQTNGTMKNYGYFIDKEDTVSSTSNSQDMPKSSLNIKYILQAKVTELKTEIENYQALNAQLSERCKERDEMVRKLNREYDGIEKYKKEERNKLNTELENERRQFKREKETFNRYQKLCKDNPTRKEREELHAARQEVEKLQEELKRQKIKYNNDTKRMKNQLIAAEKERDTLKLENISLKAQCQELLHTLKSRELKIKKDSLVSKKKAEMNENENNKLNNISNQTTNSQNSSVEIIEKSCSDPKNPINNECDKLSSSLKPRVRFNLVPQFEKEENQKIDLENIPSKEFETNVLSEYAIDVNDDPGVESIKLLEFNESVPKEIKHGNKIEKIYPSGNREIIFPNGTRKIIDINEKVTKIFFHNGDVKDIYPDKRVIYRYKNGQVQTRYPCGLHITEFPDGQVLHHFPDGFKEVKFPDGTIQYIHSDGSEEIISKDGTKCTKGVDGTEIIESKNGEKEIRTKTYKRREFLDGSVRILSYSGRKETRYSNGRIKIKDKNGKTIVDTKNFKG